MLRWGLTLLFLLAGLVEVPAQPTTRPCVTIGTVCAPVSASNPMPVSGTITTTPGGTQDVNLTQILGVAAVTGSGTATGALRVELPTNGTGVIATVGAVTALTNALPAGSNIIGNVRIDQTTPGTTNAIVVTPSSVSGAAVAPVATAALATGLIVKASAGNLYSLSIAADSTLSGAAWWAMIHNSATVPAAGAVTPTKCYAMASGTTMLALTFTAPVRFSTGISVSVSTTGCFSQTDSVHAFISGDAS